MDTVYGIPYPMYSLLDSASGETYITIRFMQSESERVMPHQERNTWVSLLIGIAINAYVILRLREMYATGALDGPDAAQVFGSLIVWVIVVAIGLTVGATILFSILYAIATRQEDGDLVTDERDRLFENRAMGATMFVAMAGFVGAFGALAWGIAPVTVFVMLYFAIAAGSIAGDLVRLASYRAGG